MRKSEITILICVFILSGLGLWSLAAVAPLNPNQPLLKQLLGKQLLFLLAGLVLMMLIMFPSYLNFRRAAFYLYGIGLVLLLALLVQEQAVRGTKRWIRLGAQFSFQPSEIMKLALVLTLGCTMMYQKSITTWKGLVRPFLLTLFPMLLVLKQPDLGTALVFFPLLLVMTFIAGASRRHLALILVFCLVSMPLGYLFVLKDYQKERVLAFLMPEKVPKDKKFQRDQSITATATGGLLGTSADERTDPSFVPMRHSDFIFSAVGEGWGFLGTTAVLACFALLIYHTLRIAYQTREPLGRLLVVGCTTVIAVHAIVNIGMAIGVAPITGITLPFLSQGGTSLMVNFVFVGIILNVSRHWVLTLSGRDFGNDDRSMKTVTRKLPF